ncbi:hypothetical protein KK120_07015 [Virgibacillus dakarensis]|nr:hypothetical protein [Virgibacillus dakarensis]
MVEKTEPKINGHAKIDKTQDTDLVELAGYHAYKKYKKPEVIAVNGKDFRVKNSKYDTDSGLDALTVQNLETGELTIVFVGSQQLDKDWIGTNTKLLRDIPPAQLEDAKAYFKEVNEKIGPVTSITGNSLGGALTNAVAIDHPNVKAVTLNPAILPEGMPDPDNDYSHITNYFSKYDPLTKAEQALQIDNRIPGGHYTINNGLPLFSLLGSNHTGYVGMDKNGEFKVKIGNEGEPGHGFIHIGADDHIVTSLWTGEPLHGGNAGEIKINKKNMMLLADGIKNNVQGRLDLAAGYIDNSVSIVKSEGAKFYQRITEMQEVFERMLEEAAGDPLFKGIALTGYALKSCIDFLISMLDTAEEKCHFLNTILNSKPAELIEHITSTDISVETLFAPPKKHLADLNDSIDDLVSGAKNIIYEEIPKLLEGGKDAFVDAVVDELEAHYEIIQANKDKLISQLTNYESQIRGVAKAFDQKDTSLADAIETKTGPTSEMVTIPETEIVTLEDSPYLENRMKIREMQVDIAYSSFNVFVTDRLAPVVLLADGVLLLFEKALEVIIGGIDAALNIALYGNPAGWIVSMFTDYDQKIKEAARDAKQPVVEMESTVEGFRKGLGRLASNLPSVVHDFKPYIETAVFESGNFKNVRLYNVAAAAIFDEMETVFDDIVYQLSNEKGSAIQSARDVSKGVRNNISMLNGQVELGTLQ